MSRSSGGQDFLTKAKTSLPKVKTIQDFRKLQAVALPGVRLNIVDGPGDSCISWNGDCMQIFMQEVAGRHPGNRVIITVNVAGWHKSAEPKIPNNIRLINLPLYSPEHNPVEHM